MAGSYNGITIHPIQSVSISETPEYTEGGKAQKYIFSITVAAKYVVSTANHASIVSFVSGLSALMVDNGLDFSISGGSQSIRFKPRVKSVNVKEDIWVDFCDYTIEMEADSIYIGGTLVPTGVVSSTETDNSWSIEFDDSEPRFSKISHKLSVKAKSTEVGVKGWTIAKTKLETLIAEVIPESIKTASGGVFTNPHNKKTSKTLDITNGVATAEINISYHNKDFYSDLAGVTLPQDAYAYHDQTVTEKKDSNSLREILSIEGTITGLKQDPGGNRYDAASALWVNTVKPVLDDLYKDLVISSRSLSEDKVKGIINYSYEVQNKKKPTGAFLSETINITFQGSLAAPPKVMVIHNTITGGAGPIFQDIETKKARSMTITIERVGTDVAPDTLVATYRPTNSEIESDVITFTAASKKISRTTTFIWSSSTPHVLPVVSADYDLLTAKIPRPYE